MYHDLLHQHRGVIRTSVLLRAGLSRHHLDREVSAGRLERVKRGWVASPTADRALVAAARLGLTLSCITLAARLDIWVRDPGEPHFAVPRPGSEIRPERGRLHYRRPLLARGRFELADSVVNVLDLIAHCQPHEDAVAAWDSALNRKLITRQALERLPLDGVARGILDDTNPFADSGLESYVRLRLRWLRVSVITQAWLHGHRVDFLIGRHLVLQIDGRHHVGKQRTSDIAHDAELALLGYTVIRVGYEQVMHRWHEVQHLIMRAIAQGLHL